MSSSYWKRKIQLKEAHEAGYRSALNEQRPPKINRRIQDVLDALAARAAAARAAREKPSVSDTPDVDTPIPGQPVNPEVRNRKLSNIRNRMRKVSDKERDILISKSGLSGGFVDVVDVARRNQLAELIQTLRELGFPSRYTSNFYDPILLEFIRAHLELFEEFYPEGLRSPEAFRKFIEKMVRRLPTQNPPDGLPPLEGSSIDDILRRARIRPGEGEGIGG